jgi:hypothetical protein
MKKRNTIERTPRRVELMQLMASENPQIAYQAQVAFAAFLGPMVQRLLDQAATVNAIYDDVLIPKGAPQTVPVDPYQTYREGEFRVWSVTKGGSLHTQGTEGLTEYPFVFYSLDSAISFDKDYAEFARLDLMTNDIHRVVQEFVAKQERNGWAPILAALAYGATSNLNGLNNSIGATTAGIFQIDDFNNLMLRHSRIYESFAGGNVAGDYGMTDMFLSPERMADVRAFAYQPMNTRAGSLASSGATALGLPDAVRQRLFDGAGTMEIYGIQLHQLKELGVNRKLTNIFNTYYSGTPSFTVGTQDLVLGMDLGTQSCKRPVRIDKNGGQLSVKPDDQWVSRAEKIGWYMKLVESRVVVDNRFVTACFV